MSVSVDYDNFTPMKMRETEVASQILAKLVADYPGYNWHVEVNFQGEIATVRTEFGGNWGFVLHLDKVMNDPDMKVVRWAGGETLERFNLSRERASESAIEGLVLDARGYATPEM
ncbi:MAG: hypothetical protein AB7I29_14995 [Geobacter sp.]